VTNIVEGIREKKQPGRGAHDMQHGMAKSPQVTPFDSNVVIRFCSIGDAVGLVNCIGT
jgi:hypothetical protein